MALPSAHDSAHDSAQHARHASAPRAAIPHRSLVAVEHPCIIKNLDKAIVSLGGDVRLCNALLSEDGEKTIRASLRPNDPLATHIHSGCSRSDNILLKLTLPKRTGRKRKRGSNGPFLTQEEVDAGRVTPNGHRTSSAHGAGGEHGRVNYYEKAHVVMTSLRDNPTRYTVSAMGVVEESYRFRNLPDIQHAYGSNPLAKKLVDLKQLNWDAIKNFKFDSDVDSAPWAGVGPSALFIRNPATLAYGFQESGHTTWKHDHGGKDVGYQRRANTYHRLDVDAPQVPTAPLDGLVPEQLLPPHVQSLLELIRAELQHRPIVTRHYLYNRLGWSYRWRIQEAAPYAGYFFNNGPFRDCLIAWGVDPRSDPKYRQYQSISYMSYKKTGVTRHRDAFDDFLREIAQVNPERLTDAHTFDGVNISTTGNTFQFCDISDPMLRNLLDTEDIRKACAPTQQGWYHAGTWVKVCVIMKDKVNSILSSERPDNTLYNRILSWPEQFDPRDMYAKYREELVHPAANEWEKQERNVMYQVRLYMKRPRINCEIDFNRRDSEDEDENQDTDSEISEDNEGAFDEEDDEGGSSDGKNDEEDIAEEHTEDEMMEDSETKSGTDMDKDGHVGSAMDADGSR